MTNSAKTKANNQLTLSLTKSNITLMFVNLLLLLEKGKMGQFKLKLGAKIGKKTNVLNKLSNYTPISIV